MLDVHAKSYASLCGGSVVGNVAQNNRRNSEFCHLGQGGSPKIMCRPLRQPKLMVTNEIGDLTPTDATDAIDQVNR
jgi:hypothetical protein